MIRILSIAAYVMGAMFAGAAHAQGYPGKPVRLVDPYAPGGSTSLVSRALAQKFQELTGVVKAARVQVE